MGIPSLMTASYRFARRPRWIVGHVIALSAIVLFVNLGLWQLSRHDERSALDATLAARTAAPVLSIDEALGLPIEELELRRIEVTGVFDPSQEVILQARSFNGRSGHNVITPLRDAQGRFVLVNRGWVPIDTAGPPVVSAPPPPGEAQIVGIARKTEVRGNLGPIDPATGPLVRISRVDIDRLAPQIKGDLFPFYLQQVSPASRGELPLVLDAPEPGGGPPHLAYAVQWFAFAAVVAVGYPLLLRSTARKPASSAFPSRPSSEP